MHTAANCFWDSSFQFHNLKPQSNMTHAHDNTYCISFSSEIKCNSKINGMLCVL